MSVKIHAETVEYREYRHGDTSREGYLPYDEAIRGKRHGVMTTYEWTGGGS